jgi:hypothetical protein
MIQCGLVAVGLLLLHAGAGAPAQDPGAVYPAAILPFQERGAGVREMGRKVSDILFAKLVARPELMLVEREDLQRILDEHELNLSGAVTPGQATQVGQLTRAKLFHSGDFAGEAVGG